MEVARRAGLTMADVTRLQEIFATEARGASTLSSADFYDLLKSRLQLRAAEGEREQHVHATVEKNAGSDGSLDFDDFLVVVGDLVDANLATVASLLGREKHSTNHFLSHMAAILE
jgi:hypothetical protein